MNTADIFIQKGLDYCRILPLGAVRAYAYSFYAYLVLTMVNKPAFMPQNPHRLNKETREKIRTDLLAIASKCADEAERDQAPKKNEPESGKLF